MQKFSGGFCNEVSEGLRQIVTSLINKVHSEDTCQMFLSRRVLDYAPVSLSDQSVHDRVRQALHL